MLAKTNSDTWKNATADTNVTKGFIQGYVYLRVHQPDAKAFESPKHYVVQDGFGAIRLTGI